MQHNVLRDRMQELLDRADVVIDGRRPWDPQIHDERFFARVLSEGSLGLGDAYVEGWWDCDALDEFVHRVKRAGLAAEVRRRTPWWELLRARLFNLQSRRRAFHVGERHYDLGNELYRAMLDRRMIYTCARWVDTDDLDTAQERKLDLVARKLQLRPGHRVLDIGCGWGGTARYLAEHHDVSVVGITVSREQARLGREVCRGLPVEIRLLDYRDLDETFDRIVSLGMLEHVGPRNYGTYFEVVRRSLRPDGLFVLQTIGSNEATVGSDPWIERNIFPNSAIPTTRALARSVEDQWVLEHWENFGPDYDRTLRAWYANFERAWPELSAHYGDRFRRQWRFYLLACAGSFRARSNQLWQMVFSPEGVRGGYRMDPPRRAVRATVREANTPTPEHLESTS